MQKYVNILLDVYKRQVWKALMELDWHPQIITGTSVGSLNGAMFALDLYETARDMWMSTVSYTHLDVYKRQALLCPSWLDVPSWWTLINLHSISIHALLVLYPVLLVVRGLSLIHI